MIDRPPLAQRGARPRNLGTMPPSRRKAPARRPQRRGLLAASGYIALTILCLGVAALVFLIVVAPADIVRDRVIEQVKARTGRDLVVAGGTSLSIFPRLTVSLKDVSLAAPDGMEAPSTLQVSSLDAELRLWSVFSPQQAVERITLRRPVIDLIVDAAGRRSWDLSAGGRRTPAPGAVEVPGAEAPRGVARPASEPKGQGAIAVRLVDARIRYSDRRSKMRWETDGLDLTFSTAGPDAPMEISGSVVVQGFTLAIAGTSSPWPALAAGQRGELSLKVTGPAFEAAYDGALLLKQGASLDGTLSLKAASATEFAAWAGRPLPAPSGPDPVDANARLRVEQNRIEASGLRVSLGKTSMAGSIALAPAGARQHLSGTLQLSELDFGLLLQRPNQPVRGPDQPNAAPAASATPRPPNPQPPATASPSSPPQAVTAPPASDARKTWSDDPLDTSLLNVLDADLTISAGHLIYKDVKTGPGRLAIALKEGAAIITLQDIELYAGRGRGMLTLAANNDGLTAAANLQLEGVSIQPLLTDALRVPWLEGRGAIALTLAGKGLSERQIVDTLSGTVEFTASDGALLGLDAGKIVRSVQHARLPNLSISPDEKTPYSELKATFAVANGIARNRDLKLTSQQLQLTGDGMLKLGPREIDYTVRPKIVAGEPEPGAVVNIGSVEVPLSIVGPWEKPAFGIRGQEQLTNTIRKIGKNIGSPEVQEALKGLLQGSGEKRVRPRDLLDKLLKEK